MKRWAAAARPASAAPRPRRIGRRLGGRRRQRGFGDGRAGGGWAARRPAARPGVQRLEEAGGHAIAGRGGARRSSAKPGGGQVQDLEHARLARGACHPRQQVGRRRASTSWRQVAWLGSARKPSARARSISPATRRAHRPRVLLSRRLRGVLAERRQLGRGVVRVALRQQLQPQRDVAVRNHLAVSDRQHRPADVELRRNSTVESSPITLACSPARGRRKRAASRARFRARWPPCAGRPVAIAAVVDQRPLRRREHQPGSSSKRLDQPLDDSAASRSILQEKSSVGPGGAAAEEIVAREAPNVAVVQDHQHPRIVAGRAAHDLDRAVGRAVVADDHLEGARTSARAPRTGSRR